MKKVIISALSFTILACSGGGGGSSGGGGGSGGGTTTNGWMSYSVVSASSLPTCDSSTSGRLYYIEDTQSFKVCKDAGWTAIALGNSVSSVQTISNTATDYCTQFTGENCYFQGGQLIKYADGSFSLIGSWIFSYSNAGDTDTDSSTTQALFPSSYTGGYLKLNLIVARGAGYKSVYLYYIKSPEAVKVVLDTNANGVPEPSGADETLYTATLTNM